MRKRITFSSINLADFLREASHIKGCGININRCKWTPNDFGQIDVHTDDKQQTVLDLKYMSEANIKIKNI